MISLRCPCGADLYHLSRQFFYEVCEGWFAPPTGISLLAAPSRTLDISSTAKCFFRYSLPLCYHMRCVSPILAAVFFAGCLISYSGAQTTTPPPSTSSPATAAAATTKVAPLFTSGDLVLHNPVEGCSVFVSAVLAAAIIELFLDFFANIKSRYFQRVFASVREETLLVGLMTLVLIFTTSLDILHPKWEALFNYAVMCLLFMVGFFIFIVAATVGLLGMQMNRWKDFEAARIDADNVLTGREIIIRQSRDQFRESAKALKIECHPDLKFTDYMRKCTRHTVASVCDLNWKSWMALSIMIIINGVRSKISYGSIDATVNVSRSDRTANAISYICFIGYSTLGVYVLLSFLLHHRLATFSEKRIAVDSEQILSSSKHLFFAKQSTTCHIFQSIVIILEWYLALFALGMASELYNEFGGLAFLFYAAAVIPVLILCICCPGPSQLLRY